MSGRMAILIGVMTLAALPAGGQTTDTAAERARLANERIAVEAQRRAEEKRNREGETADEPAPAESAPPPFPQPASRSSAAPAPTASRPPPASPSPSPPASSLAATAPARTQAPAPMPSPAPAPVPAETRAPADDRLSTALEQLRELGELRDAGYVTEEEFQRIKARILEERF